MIDWIDVKSNNFDYFITVPLKQNIEKNVLEAAVENIKYIRDNYCPPYTLFVSGGIDSQVMLYLWKLSGFPFQALSVKYNNDLNEHDLSTIRDFAKIHDLDVEFQDFDVINFLEDEYFEFVEKFRCGSPHICTYMKFTDFLEKGTAIFSGNFLGINFPNFFTQNVFGLYRYAKATNKSIVPFFLCETQNLAFSLKEPFKSKEENYIYNGFPIIAQQRNFTGFEKIKELYDNDQRAMYSRKQILFERARNQKSMRKFDILFRNKYEHKYEKDKYVVRFTKHVE